jgi:phospholipase C
MIALTATVRPGEPLVLMHANNRRVDHLHGSLMGAQPMHSQS